MTISSTINRWTYNGDGSTTVFAYTNKIFATSDLEVYVSGALQSEGSDYSVSGVGSESGGNVTFGGAPEAGTGNVVVVRSVPTTQGTDLPLGGAFPATAVEDGLDRLTVLVQQNADRIARTLVLADSDPSTIGALPDLDARAGKYLAFDGIGQPTVGASLADMAVTYTEETFSGDGIEIVFALAATPGALSLVEVFISGVRQAPGADYTVAGTTLTFINPPPNGTNNIFVRFGQSFGGVPSDGSVTTAKIVDLAITTAKLAALAVTAAKLAADAVETAKIKDGAVTGPKLDFAGLAEEAAIDPDADFLAVLDASAGAIRKAKPANLRAAAPYVQVTHEETDGTDGGTATSGSWQTHKLNVEKQDTHALAAVASNQVTLQAGTWDLFARAAFLATGGVRLRWRNITDGTTALGPGETGGAAVPQTQQANYWCEVRGRFTIAAAKTFELQYFCEATVSTTGLGNQDAITAGDEIYATVELRKVAA